MTDKDEPFLSRWSRLKREAATGAGRQDADPTGRAEVGSGPPARTPPARTKGTDSLPQQAGNPPGDEAGKAGKAGGDIENIDLDKLDATSDYRPFMRADVPDAVRSKALSKLWLSDPVLSGPEQLSDYMEDFTDAARAVPRGLLKTAYKVGQGFLSDEEVAEWDRLGRKEPVPPAASPEIVVRPESPDQPEVAAFLAASDAHAQELYPPESNHLVDLATLTAPNARFFVARRGGNAIGCGALLVADDGWGEVKRMWVAPEARGQGVGRKLLETIEAVARESELTMLRLETGIRQPEAIALYRSCGFTECEPFGHYRPDPLSLFMEKRLS